MMVDHSLANYSVWGLPQGGWFSPVRWIWARDRHGELSPHVFLILIASTVVAERLLLWLFLRGYPHLSVAACFDFIKRPLRNGWGYGELRSVVLRIQSLSLYVLSYRRLAFLLIHWKGDLPPNKTIFGPLLARCTGKVAISQLAVRQS